MDQDAHPHLKTRLAGFQDEAGEFEVRIEGRFSAAHFLLKYFPDGSDEPMHGHSWLVEVTLGRAGQGIGADGICYDFLAARRRLDELCERMEHVVINNLSEFAGVNPTAENVARWFYRGLKEDVHATGGRVIELRVHEGPGNVALFRPA